MDDLLVVNKASIYRHPNYLRMLLVAVVQEPIRSAHIVFTALCWSDVLVGLRKATCADTEKTCTVQRENAALEIKHDNWLNVVPLSLWTFDDQLISAIIMSGMKHLRYAHLLGFSLYLVLHSHMQLTQTGVRQLGWGKRGWENVWMLFLHTFSQLWQCNFYMQRKFI